MKYALLKKVVTNGVENIFMTNIYETNDMDSVLRLTGQKGYNVILVKDAVPGVAIEDSFRLVATNVIK